MTSEASFHRPLERSCVMIVDAAASEGYTPAILLRRCPIVIQEFDIA